jgi:transcriptional regulator with GAF, ATPase, and Fis domain
MVAKIKANEKTAPTQLITTYKEMLHDKEKDLIIAALKEAKFNKTKASQVLGKSRP